MIEVRRYADARAFLERAESWLLDAEIERAVALQSSRNALANEAYYEKPVYWATVEDDGRIIGCAFRTPPFNVGVTALPAAAIAPLTASLRQSYAQLPGISGTEPTASALAAAWTGRPSGSWRVQSRQWLWSLTSVEAPDGAPAGSLRPAAAADTALANDWGAAFARDSGVAALDGAFCTRLIGAGLLYLWDDGSPRCMVGVLRHTAKSAALGMVYTPPELRRKRYATSAIAAWSRQVLDRGQRCFLLPDAANTASTVICRNLGHELVLEGVDIEFR